MGQSRDRRGRFGRTREQEGASVSLPPATDQFGLLASDLSRWMDEFGADEEQIRHDYAISHALAAMSAHSDRFIFFGGTALSRTVLDGLRLSEDIDLLSVGPRREAAAMLDEALRSGLERRFGRIQATPSLYEVRRSTDACVYRIGDSGVQIQLINGVEYARWPTTTSTIIQRYLGMDDLRLTTFAPAGFVGAKTAAWCDTTRNAPRDLYDLWALAERGHVNADAAEVFRKCGPTSSYPASWLLPKKPPSQNEWWDKLGHQGRVRVDPDQAFEVVQDAWAVATSEAERLRRGDPR